MARRDTMLSFVVAPFDWDAVDDTGGGEKVPFAIDRAMSRNLGEIQCYIGCRPRVDRQRLVNSASLDVRSRWW